MEPFSIYLHIPFCSHRCSYCDFNTYTGLEEVIPEYIQALCTEIKFVSESFGGKVPIHSIFFGGGTPSLLPDGEIGRVFEVLHQEFDLQRGLEITLEANPDKLSLAYLANLKQLGINRISLGVQSADAQDLQILDRQHDFSQAATAVTLIRKAGFENLNLDLIFGVPQQTLESWINSLNSAIELEPDHISLYSLTLERGTPLTDWVDKGFLPEPNQDLSADMYAWSADRLAQSGFRQYEISNWAQTDSSGNLMACRHNLQYWRNLPYLGFGAGAHGYAGGVRIANVLSPHEYIYKCLSFLDGGKFAFPRTPATDKIVEVDRDLEMDETMMMGLRLTEEGVSRPVFLERFGIDMDDQFSDEIGKLVKLGLLEWDVNGEERLRLSPQGRLLGNQVFIHFI